MGSFNPTSADLKGTRGLSKEKQKAAAKEGKTKAKKDAGAVPLSQAEILKKLAAGDLTAEEAGALLNTKKQAGLYCRANPEKGTISLYGMQRMPITLYRNQWERLLPGCDRATHPVLSFIDEHKQYLPEQKGDKTDKVPKDLIGEGKPFRIPVAREEE